MENNEINEIASTAVNDSAVKIIKLDKSNASFTMKNKFLSLTLNDGGEIKEYPKVILHRAFPHELLWEYISVIGEESREIGLIYNIEDFEEPVLSMLKTELERKYYSPVIVEITGLKERYGFSYWTAISKEGKKLTFTMQDTFRNIIHTGEDSLILSDVDGNRFTIESVVALDRKSYRKIELYL